MYPESTILNSLLLYFRQELLWQELWRHELQLQLELGVDPVVGLHLLTTAISTSLIICYYVSYLVLYLDLLLQHVLHLLGHDVHLRHPVPPHLGPISGQYMARCGPMRAEYRGHVTNHSSPCPRRPPPARAGGAWPAAAPSPALTPPSSVCPTCISTLCIYIYSSRHRIYIYIYIYSYICSCLSYTMLFSNSSW